MIRVANPEDLHPLAGTKREPGWTVQSETDALEACEVKLMEILGEIACRHGTDEMMLIALAVGEK